MKYFKNITLAVLCACLSSSATAQQTAYADISISSLSLTAAGAVKKIPAKTSSSNPVNRPVTVTASDDVLKCSITISNATPVNAYGAKLLVILPPGATVPAGSLPPNATLISERVQTGAGPGYIQFDLAVIFSNQPVTVEFTFTKSININKLSVFAFCGVPDANPGNNYKDVTY